MLGDLALPWKPRLDLDGKTRYAIENATRTRIVLADSKIHVLGSFANIKMARDAICALILGSPISKVYTNLRGAAARRDQRSAAPHIRTGKSNRVRARARPPTSTTVASVTPRSCCCSSAASSRCSAAAARCAAADGTCSSWSERPRVAS